MFLVSSIQKLASFFDKLMRRYTPDPFILALFLTFLVLVFGLTATDSTITQMIDYWGGGFWKLIGFTLQMVMVFVGGYVVASAPPVRRILQSFARAARSPSHAVFIISVLSLAASWINWGFGLVIGGLMCKEMALVMPRVNFRLLVASAYSGFLVWHGGLSASIPLSIATPGNFTETLIGGTIPVTDTIFSTFNLICVLTLFVALPLSNWLMSLSEDKDDISLSDSQHKEIPLSTHKAVPSEKLETSRLISFLAGTMGLGYIFLQILTHTFTLDLNSINFIFLFSGLILHKHPRAFIHAVEDAAKKVGPMLLQFPFYGGLMGMIMHSGIGNLVSQFFVDISTPTTFPLFTFFSAGILNLFVPSGGGQWAVQGPVIIKAATEIGASLPISALAVSWGDAWTNMLQPFWALPLLAIAGLKLRDIMGYCVVALLVSGVLLSALFLWFSTT